MQPDKKQSGVLIKAAPHPLKAGRFVTYVEPGKSIAEILEIVQPDPVLRAHAHVSYRGRTIDRYWWPKYRPREGSELEIRILPQGDILRDLLIIAVIVAAVVLGPEVAGLLGFTAGTIGFTVASTFATLAISTVGMLAVNMIAPIQGPSAPKAYKDSPTFSISGTQNSLTPFAPLPAIFGEYRAFPPLGSVQYTEILGDKQYLWLLVVWGYGPMHIKRLKIGETKIGDFKHVKIEHREGYPDDEPLTIFPNIVSEDDFTIQLTNAKGWQTRTTLTDEARALSVDIVFPNGLVTYSKSGNRQSATVKIEVEYRLKGDTDWLAPASELATQGTAGHNNSGDSGTLNDDTLDLSATAILEANVIQPDNGGANIGYSITAKSADPVRHGFKWYVPNAGQYEVRVRRTTADSNSTLTQDDSYWTALRGFTHKDPLNFPAPVAKTAIRIQATDQLNGIISELSGQIRMVAKDWDSGSQTWIVRATSSPAAAFLWQLTGPFLATPYDESDVDLDALAAWSEFCEDNGFEFCLYRDYSNSLWDALTDICVAGRGSPAMIDGKWSVVFDDPSYSGQQVPVQHFTPRNSWNFQGTKVFPEQPHAYRIQFQNRENGWKTDERIVYQDGYDETNATIFEQFATVGITDPEHIHRHGRFHLKQATHRPESWSFDTDFEHLVAMRGDRVLITHDVLLVGLGSGRIKDVILGGDGNITGIVSDERFQLNGHDTYAISIRTPNNGQIVKTLDTGATGTEPTNILTLSGFISGSIQSDIVGALFGFGLSDSVTLDALLLTVQGSQDLGATLTCVPWSEDIYDRGVIPPYSPSVTLLGEIPAPANVEIVSDDSQLFYDSAGTVHIRATLTAQPLNWPLAYLEVQIRSGNGKWHPAEAVRTGRHAVTFEGIQTGEVIDVRARWHVGDRIPGLWTEVLGYTVIGKSALPAALSGLTGQVQGTNFYVRWDQPSDIDLRYGGYVEFRRSDDLANPQWVASSQIGAHVDVGACNATLPLLEGSYLARVFDSSGRPSAEVSAIKYQKLASVLTFDALSPIDEAA